MFVITEFWALYLVLLHEHYWPFSFAISSNCATSRAHQLLSLHSCHERRHQFNTVFAINIAYFIIYAQLPRTFKLSELPLGNSETFLPSILAHSLRTVLPPGVPLWQIPFVVIRICQAENYHIYGLYCFWFYIIK
jgi:hypothetical protein